ncbi:MAG: hypothetical protein R3F19_03590 [Verrucomicrobiales bacterium]
MELDSGFAQRAALHNAHIGSFYKILYPYHPLFGKEYEIFGSALGRKDLVYVRLPDHSTRGVPAWMFDPGICAGIRSGNEPLIDTHALLRLAHLLDSAHPGGRTVRHERTTVRKQDRDTHRKA